MFDSLAGKWDEAVPLGNGQVGALVWQKGDRLRFSLDRVDLWDLRPTEGMTWDKPVYDWICEQWQNNTYGTVQELLDEPYGRLPAPSKIPAGALEFHTADWGAADSVRLYVQNAVCKVWWPSGRTLEAFVQSDGPCGWFRFTGIDSLRPEIVAPAYAQVGASAEDDAHSGQELYTLGYPQGVVHMKGRTITYVQPGWNGFQYAIAVTWKKTRGGIEGVWSVQSTYGGNSVKNIASDVRETLGEGYADAYKVHRAWWQRFWDKSAVSLPDSVLEKQWYLEQYKFGSAARADMPPITLQAVWTADNGKLPPWKGDFHHDLNTQLSYWPAYGANHLDEEIGFTNWLWSHRDAFRRYTEGFFGRGGLNVPGVTTLDGEPMGGWCQYSMSPTVSAWLGHHFYLHWRYSGDRTYLEERAYPWIAGTATFLEQLSVKDAQGRRRLPLGSSPEINDNRREAWFPTMTNYDLALTRFTFDKAAELAGALGKSEAAGGGRSAASGAIMWHDESGLNFAEGLPYTESHRHFSHLMAFHPLGLLDPSQGDSVRRILQKQHGDARADWARMVVRVFVQLGRRYVGPYGRRGAGCGRAARFRTMLLPEEQLPCQRRPKPERQIEFYVPAFYARGEYGVRFVAAGDAVAKPYRNRSHFSGDSAVVEGCFVPYAADRRGISGFGGDAGRQSVGSESVFDGRRSAARAQYVFPSDRS